MSDNWEHAAGTGGIDGEESDPPQPYKPKWASSAAAVAAPSFRSFRREKFCIGFRLRCAAGSKGGSGPGHEKGAAHLESPRKKLSLLRWFRGLRAGFLGGRVGFFTDGAARLGENVWRYGLHVMRGLRVFSGFLENFVVGVAAYFEITSGVYIATFQDFCHSGVSL